MDASAALVSKYMAARRSQDAGSSQMQTEEVYQDYEEDIIVEEDEDDEDEDYELEEDFDEEEISEGSNAAGQRRKFRSKSWREFLPIHVDGEVTKGECKHCGAEISAKRGQGTSGLRNHLHRCKDRAKVVGALSQMNASLMTPDGVSRLWKWDPEAAKKMLALGTNFLERRKNRFMATKLQLWRFNPAPMHIHMHELVKIYPSGQLSMNLSRSLPILL